MGVKKTIVRDPTAVADRDHVTSLYCSDTLHTEVGGPPSCCSQVLLDKVAAGWGRSLWSHNFGLPNVTLVL